MAKLDIKKGSTSVSLYIFIQDSSSTVGAGLTGLVWNSGSLVAYYVRPLGSATQITLATQTVTGAWSSGGFVEVSSANMPGVYRLDIPDAAIATGVNSVVVMLKGATNMVPLLLEIELDAIDTQDAVHLGLSALPNAAAGASGGLPLSADAAGRVDVIKVNGTSQTARDLGGQLDAAVTTRLAPTVAGRTLDVSAGGEAGLDWANIGSPTTVVGLSGTTVKTATDVETDTQDIQGRLPAALVSGRMDASVGAYQSGQAPLQPTVSGRTLDVSATGEAGIDWANIGAPTTTQNLSGTTVKTATDVETDTQDIQARLPAALTGAGNIKADAQVVSDKTGYALTAAYDPAKTAAQAGDAMTLTSGERTTLTAAIWAALTSGLTTVGSIGKRLVDDIDAAISSRLATSGYTAPDNTSIAAIKIVTDKFLFDAANNVKASIEAILGTVFTEGAVGRIANAFKTFFNVASPTATAASIDQTGDSYAWLTASHRYAARVHVVRDETGTTDRYEVVWFKDGEVWAGTVTTPKIEVMKESDGSDLIAYQALPVSPALGLLYEATGAELQADGEGYVVYLDATIDGATRQWWEPVGVDTDADVAAIRAKTDKLKSDPAGVSDLIAMADHYERAVSNREVEPGISRIEAERLVLASQVGKLSGATEDDNPDTIRIRDPNDRIDRIVATSPDGAGNRTAVTVDAEELE